MSMAKKMPQIYAAAERQMSIDNFAEGGSLKVDHDIRMRKLRNVLADKRKKRRFLDDGKVSKRRLTHG
jgi:hypothetical protein